LIKKYILIFLIFTAALINGRNFDFSTRGERELISQIEALQKQLSAQRQISGGEQFTTIDLGTETEPAQYYRVLYNLSSAYQSDTGQDFTIALKLFAEGEYGSQLIEELTIPEGANMYNREIIFKSEERAGMLRLVKFSDNYNRAITISNVKCRHLTENPQYLRSTIVGITNESVNVLGGDESSKSNYFRLKNQVIGTVVEPQSDLISGVDFKMKFAGSGGKNNYSVIICEVDEQNRPMITSAISRYYFSQGSAQNLKIGLSLYRFPILARTEKGKRYFIGISNQGVEFNYFNTLAVLGGSEKSPENNLSLLVYDNGRIKQIGPLFIRVYGPGVSDPQGYFLSNAIFQDVGNRVGFYDYIQSGRPRDLIDISSVENAKTSDIFFDNNYSGIMGNAENNIAFIYKFDAGFPIEQAKVTLNQVPAPIVDSLIYYSTDGITWNEIAVEKKEASSTGSFSKVIDVARGSDALYLKVTYDQGDKKYRSTQLFGVQALNIHMSLFLP
jgi:hypothetical protein